MEMLRAKSEAFWDNATLRPVTVEYGHVRRTSQGTPRKAVPAQEAVNEAETTPSALERDGI